MRERTVPEAEIRALLRMVRGVASVDVETGPGGEIAAIEIAVRPDEPPRRVIRDVESALLSGLGLSVDHRVVRVSQGDGSGTHNGRNARSRSAGSRSVQFLQDLAPEATPPRLREERVRLQGVVVEPDGELYCTVTVELEMDGEKFTGTAREADTPRATLVAAGRATLGALVRTFERETALALEGIEEFAIADQPAVIARIEARRGRDVQAFHGTALTEGRPHRAAARAVLNAINRYWGAQDHAAPEQAT